MHEIIFFDIDGTLLNHEAAKKIGIRKFWEKYNRYFSCYNQNEFEDLWVKTSDKYFQKYLRKEITFKQQRAFRLVEIFKSVDIVIDEATAFSYFIEYLKEYESAWAPCDDVLECLERLKTIKLGIISNGDREQQMYKLEKIGILRYFQLFIFSSDIKYLERGIEIFEEASKQSKCRYSEMLYIGDSVVEDMEPCKKLGIPAVLIDRDNIHKDYIGNRINNLNKIPEIIGLTEN